MDEQTHLGFSVDLEGIDRRALLMRAAQELDGMQDHLGGERGPTRETPNGALMREIADDEVRTGFDKEGAIFPYKYTRGDFKGAKDGVPVRFRKLSQDFNFYEMRIPFNLRTSPAWPFNFLEMQVILKAAADFQPIAYQILPDKKFQSYIEGNARFEVGLNANFEFAVATPLFEVPTTVPGVGVKAGADAGAKVGGGVDVVIRPFTFRWGKMKINNDGVGTRRVFWRIDGLEFFQENDLTLLIVVQAPKTVKELIVDAQMAAARYPGSASAKLQKALKQLTHTSDASFIDDGAATRDKHAWVIPLK